MSVNQMTIYHTIMEVFKILHNKSSEQINDKYRHLDRHSLRKNTNNFLSLLTSFYSAFLTPPQEMADWRSLRPSDVLNALIRTVIINIMLIVLKKSDKRLSPPKCAKCKSTLPESQSHRRIPHWGKINYWRMAAPSTTTTSQRSLHCT